MGKALIIGAGAIGRGFLPWALDGFDIDFFDVSQDLVSGIKNQGGYTTFRSLDGLLQEKWVQPSTITSDPDDLAFEAYDLAFAAVGPRNASKLDQRFGELRCPIFSLENDPKTVSTMVQILGKQDIFFGVPDVITSSTASPKNLAKDKFSIHTEDGVLYLSDDGHVSESARQLLDRVEWSDESLMRKEWDAKLYLHNTPHCVAAYIGNLLGKTYVHEGFESDYLTEVVQGVIAEMLMSLKLLTTHDHYFLEEYATKELRRFSNPLLFDPISRVAREPLRKLQAGGRLTGALSMALLAGVRPHYTLLGIVSALRYLAPSDPDFLTMSNLRSFELEDFLAYHTGLSDSSLESRHIVQNFAGALATLERKLL